MMRLMLVVAPEMVAPPEMVANPEALCVVTPLTAPPVVTSKAAESTKSYLHH